MTNYSVQGRKIPHSNLDHFERISVMSTFLGGALCEFGCIKVQRTRIETTRKTTQLKKITPRGILQ